jgi:hypothetical protein
VPQCCQDQIRILGHASPTITMDLYGHVTDTNLWKAAKKFGTVEPPKRIELLTFSLRAGPGGGGRE